MSINIDALFQHLMEDPDIVPPEGEEKEDIAMAMATQRARQSNNNIKALNMAKEDSTISKLLAFLKADGDKEFIDEFNKHQRNFELHGKKMLAAAKKGIEYEWPKIKAGDIEGDERVGETSYKGKVEKKQWDDAYEFLTEHYPGMIDEHEKKIAWATGGQLVDVEGDDDVEAEAEGEEVQAPSSAARTRTPKESMGTRLAGLTEAEEEARAGMSREERMADAQEERN